MVSLAGSRQNAHGKTRSLQSRHVRSSASGHRPDLYTKRQPAEQKRIRRDPQHVLRGHF